MSISQESLALSFEGVTLHDDALSQYGQLETAFFQVLGEKSKTLSWFGPLLPRDVAADGAPPLLAVDAKPYRAMILANAVSVFDFRVYLLARQCILLGKMGRVVDVARKVVSFLGGFGHRLREVAVRGLLDCCNVRSG
jgi:hypothetical protein